MPFLFGTSTEFGVPVTLAFSFDGTSRDWGSTIAHHIEPISNRAESIDGNYQISDLDVEFIDTTGSLWTTLGHGTTAFNKDMTLTAYIGGTMDFTNDRLKLQNTGNAATFLIHRGKVTKVGRRNRLVRITSKNNLRLIGDLEWQFPYHSVPIIPDRVIGSYYFFDSHHVGTLYTKAAIRANEDLDTFETYTAAGTVDQPLSVLYPSIAGRGTLGLETGYHYPGTQFYFDIPRVKHKGTWLGTKFGTINTDEEAQRFGYANTAAAEPYKQTTGPGPEGTFYPVNRTRMHVSGGTNTVGSVFYFQQNLTLSESPANLFRELTTGHCVSPYFTTADIDTDTFTTAQLQTGFQSFVYKVDPKGGKAADALKNLMESLYGLYSVNPENKFEFRPYAPRKLRITPTSLGSSDVLETSVDNDIADYYNRIVLDHAYDPDSGEFTRRTEIKSADWTTPLDRPYTLESRFLVNENEAVVFANRLLRRFKSTVPRVEVKTTMKYAGAPIGSLYTLQDSDSIVGSKTVEVLGYKKDFSEDRTVILDCLDADTLYLRKGFAYWGTKADLPGDTVDSTSDSGWGTGGTSGTCPGINTPLHGSAFVWW